MTQVFGWLADNAGCGWYRMVVPLQEFAARGGTASWDERMPISAYEEADVIIGQRVGKEGATGLWQALAQEKRLKQVFEVDDDLFNIDPSNVTAYEFWGHPDLQANVVRNAEVADVVTVTTEPLAEVFRRINPNVVVVPNRVPRWLTEHTRPQRERLTVGWAGSGTHAMDFSEAGPQLTRFLGRNPQVSYHAIGGLYGYAKKIQPGQVQLTQWFDDVSDYYRSIDFDIAIAPLRAHVFNTSKSSIKALEMAALGIPIVASAVRPYEDFVQHGVTGYLVRRDHEWGQYLRALTEDPDMRAEMGATARRLATQHTVEGNLGSWLGAWGVTESSLEAAA